jgi:hypothetical protein
MKTSHAIDGLSSITYNCRFKHRFYGIGEKSRGTFSSKGSEKVKKYAGVLIQRKKCAGFPYLEEERGERAGPPSPQEGETLDPEPVEPGEVAGTPVTSCNKNNNW